MTKAKTTAYLAVAILLTLALTGCRTTRSAADKAAHLTRKQRSELLTPLAQYPTDIQAITAKTTIALNYDGHLTTVKGRLRMRRDEVVQVSITALGLMEIASIELTPKRGYLIDRVNKRYAVVDYSSAWMSYAGISFSAVQALFWNRLFIPGEKEAWRNTENFTLRNAGTQCLVEPKQQRVLKCRFYTDADCKQLQQTDLTLQQYAATWRYGQFEHYGDYSYPTMHDVSVSGAARTMGARIGLTGVATIDTGWSATTDLTRYREVPLEQLLSILNMIR